MDVLSRRLRLRAILLLVACLVMAGSAFFPWIVVTNVVYSTGEVIHVEHHDIQNVCAMLFFPLWLPLALLTWGAFQEWRAPLTHDMSTRSAVWLSISGLLCTLALSLVLAVLEAFADFVPGWGRGAQTTLTPGIGGAFCMTAYLLAMAVCVGLRSDVVPTNMSMRRD